ncbi:TPA: TrbI/VirB10 family protein [Candidatus Galligastranaerophilus gallistercoris]|nr:TrbI/VirB10 family protein [Candidatus Galligastranaerophilus gallistercoris]
MKKITGLRVLTALLLSGALIVPCAYAANFSYSTPNTYNAQNTGNLQGKVTYVPAGTVSTVMLSNSLSSESTTVGSPVSVTLVNDLMYNGKLIASKGSVLNGTVIKAKKAGFGNRNGQIQVIFNTMTTPQGYNIPVNAVFKTDDNSGILKGGATKDSAKDYAKNTVVGAGAGAALGTAMGALSDGSVGKGAIYGTAIGGGLGLIKGAATKGDNLTVPSGAYLDIYFTQPITLSAPEEYKYEY